MPLDVQEGPVLLEPHDLRMEKVWFPIATQDQEWRGWWTDGRGPGSGVFMDSRGAATHPALSHGFIGS